MISFASILQRFWPEIQNSYFVEHFLMTIQEILKYAIVYYISLVVFLVLFLIDTEEIKSLEIQAVE